MPSRLRRFLWLLAFGVPALVAGCTPSVPLDGDTPDRACTTLAGLGQVVLLDPAFFSVVGGGSLGWPVAYEFRWDFIDGCWPNGGFNVHISTEPGALMSTVRGNVGRSPLSVLSFRYALEPGRRYYWTVSPVQDGVEAPLHVGVGRSPGTTPRRWSFWTGPYCDVYSLGPPTLVSPVNGAIVRNLSPLLSYRYGTGACAPREYHIDLSNDPFFSGGLPWMRTTVPATGISPDPLEDCRWYYWRVRAVGELGERGPISTIWRFYTNDRGVCPAPEAPLAIDPGPVVPLPTEDVPFARPRLEIACRFGPGDAYALVRYLSADDRLALLARDLDASWLQVSLEGAPWCWTLGKDLEPEDPDFGFDDLPLGEWGLLPTKTPTGGPTVGCLIQNPNNPNDPKDLICVPRACGPNDFPGGACTP